MSSRYTPGGRAATPAGDEIEVRELVELIVKALVDHPEQVRCHEIEGSHASMLELEVARDDVGKVIGRNGVHADAIRRLITAIGGKRKKRYILEILDDTKGHHA